MLADYTILISRAENRFVLARAESDAVLGAICIRPERASIRFSPREISRLSFSFSLPFFPLFFSPLFSHSYVKSRFNYEQNRI